MWSMRGLLLALVWIAGCGADVGPTPESFVDLDAVKQSQGMDWTEAGSSAPMAMDEGVSREPDSGVSPGSQPLQDSGRISPVVQPMPSAVPPQPSSSTPDHMPQPDPIDAGTPDSGQGSDARVVDAQPSEEASVDTQDSGMVEDPGAKDAAVVDGSTGDASPVKDPPDPDPLENCDPDVFEVGPEHSEHYLAPVDMGILDYGDLGGTTWGTTLDTGDDKDFLMASTDLRESAKPVRLRVTSNAHITQVHVQCQVDMCEGGIAWPQSNGAVWCAAFFPPAEGDVHEVELRFRCTEWDGVWRGRTNFRMQVGTVQPSAPVCEVETDVSYEPAP